MDAAQNPAKQDQAGKRQKKLLRVAGVARKLDSGVSTVWFRSKNDPDFPKPFPLGAKTTVWDEEELDAYIERMKSKARANSAAKEVA